MDVCKGNDLAAVVTVFLFNDALQRNAAEVIVDGFVQVFPKVVRQAGRAVVAVGFAAALGGVQLVFGGGNDLGDIDLGGRGGEDVAAAGAAQAFNQPGTPQFAE